MREDSQAPYIRSLRAPAGLAEGLTTPAPWLTSWGPSPYLA